MFSLQGFIWNCRDVQSYTDITKENKDGDREREREKEREKEREEERERAQERDIQREKE